MGLTNPTVALKVELSEVLGDFEDRWTRARYWLQQNFEANKSKAEEEIADSD